MSGTPPWKFRGGTHSFGSVVSVLFDPEYETIWSCDALGMLTSFVSQPPHPEELDWHSYCSVRVFDGPTIGMQPFQDKIICASGNALRMLKKGGMLLNTYKISPTLQRKVTTFQADSIHSNILLAGDMPGITRIPINESGFQEDPIVVAVDGSITAMKLLQNSLVVGTAGGTLSIRDPRTLQLNGLEVKTGSKVAAVDSKNFLVATAHFERTAACVKLFDVRNLEEPLQLFQGLLGLPASVSIYSDSVNTTPRILFVTNQCFHVLQSDTPQPLFTSSSIAEGICTAGAVSENGRCALIGNDRSVIIALSSVDFGSDYYIHDVPSYPPMAKPPTFTSAWSENKDGDITAGFDFSVSDTQLLSNWPPANYMVLAIENKIRSAPPPNARLTVGHHLNTLGLTRSDVYLPDPKDKVAQVVPNPFPYNEHLGDDPSKVAQILMELRKKRRTVTRRGELGYYGRCEEAINNAYSSHFEWKGFNGTKDIVGLDNSLPEAWIMNCVVQCLYNLYPPWFPVRKALIRHVCKRFSCVACELSILFNNMIVQVQNGNSPICQTSNLLRCLRSMPVFHNCLQPALTRDEAVAKLHEVQRLLLQAIDRDLRVSPDKKIFHVGPDIQDTIVQLFGTECSATRPVKPIFFWNVPASASKVDEGLQHLLKQLEAIGDDVQISRLPPILVLLMNPEHGHLKPPQSLTFSRPPKEEFKYIQSSCIIHLADDPEDPGHFVSHHRYDKDLFVLINDYFVSAPTPEEALESSIPAIISHSVVVAYYVLDGFRVQRFTGGREQELQPVNLFSALSPLLLDDYFSKKFHHEGTTIFKPPSTFVTDLRPSDLVALDAEYVVLKWGNVKGPDEPEWIRKQRKVTMSLARVSCIVSTKPGDERTIVDDYVETTEEVHDYVTQYSGIHAGDLTASVSKHHLTSSKATYLKLRALADAGVKFVGHGLAQDFRVCNISVPDSQIIDTLELYRKPGSRKLALRFLAFHVLGERVQEDEHDSVEDARTSLRLYYKYQELKQRAEFDDILEMIYIKGSDSNWCIPEEASHSVPRSSRIELDVSPPPQTPSSTLLLQ